MTQIRLLYAVEKYCAENKYTPDEIKNYRQLHAIPVLKVLHELLKTQVSSSLPKSPLGMALQYTLARWDKLNVYTWVVSAGLPIGRGILKSRMNRAVHVRFREELGVKIPLLTRLVTGKFWGGFCRHVIYGYPNSSL